MSDIEYQMELLANSTDPSDIEKALRFYQDYYIKHNIKPEKSPVMSWERKTAAEILATDYPPLNWVVENLIPEGLSVIHGSPKAGKSFLALNLATAVSYGGCFLGIDNKVEQHEVLYLALEDGFPRIKNRLEKQGGLANKKLFVETAQTWKGGIGALKSYVEKFPDTKLIIIDTLFKFAPLDDFNDYAKVSRSLQLIQEIATEKRISIVLIHHTRKGNSNTGENWADSGLGSQGLNGACDSLLLLQKKDGKSEGSLFVKGRDIEEKSYSLVFDKDLCCWRIIGESEIAKGDPKAQAEVLSLLEKNPEGLKTSDIALMLGKKDNAISNILKILDGKGKAKKQENKWIYSQFHDNSQMNNSENVNNKEFTNSYSLRDNENVNKNEPDIY